MLEVRGKGHKNTQHSVNFVLARKEKLTLIASSQERIYGTFSSPGREVSTEGMRPNRDSLELSVLIIDVH